MWNNLSISDREEYKKMILAFASLTEMFAQKAEDSDGSEIILSPIINSKYQETVFQRVFHASAEDIGNTSYDAAIAHTDKDGKVTKYLIGIKTFGINSGAQKIAQFKANHDEWSDIVNAIKENAKNSDGSLKSKEEIDSINKDLYYELAKSIAYLRNIRIESSESNLQGFSLSVEKDNIEAVYHVLMPSKKGDAPVIYVGEASYNKIDIDSIKILGCTSAKNPTNFEFTDGIHKYKYTPADSQLYMDFENSSIVQESWDVIYAEDAYKIFSEIANKTKAEQKEVTESYSWLITNKLDEVEKFSGFNNFYGLGSKTKKEDRIKNLNKIKKTYESEIPAPQLNEIYNDIIEYWNIDAQSKQKKLEKNKFRSKILDNANCLNNDNFFNDIRNCIFRPKYEAYIPIPNSKTFHENHPNFFNESSRPYIQKNCDWTKEEFPIEARQFTLIFEPSGTKVESYVNQDNGKSIQSIHTQASLGKWLLKDIFQLEDYEPLTAKRLNELEINGIRLEKRKGSDDIHLYFIWIDKDNPPDDFIDKTKSKSKKTK